MPIPAEKLKEAQQPLSNRIFEFLQRNKSLAFTSLEIMVALEGDTPPLGIRFALMASTTREKFIAEYADALGELLKKKMAKAGKVSGETYWAAL